MASTVIIHCEAETADCVIAGVGSLDRLVVAASRAGCERIVLVGWSGLPALPRAMARGILPEAMPATPDLGESVLVLSTDVFVQAEDLRRLREKGGRLESAEGGFLPVGILFRPRASWREDLRGLAPLWAAGVALPLRNALDRQAAEAALWRSLASSADGIVDRWFNRPVGRLFAKRLASTLVTPNPISVASTLLGVASAVCFAVGGAAASIWGAVLLQVSAVIDCVDGDVARAALKESPMGKWLDLIGDQVVHVTLFAGLGVGLWRAGSDAPVGWLAGSAVVGAVLSFLVVLRGMRRPEAMRNPRLQGLIDAATNRDFSVLLLALALAGRTEWFLWLTAAGVHLFWIAALAVQLLPMGRAAAWEPGRGHSS